MRGFVDRLRHAPRAVRGEDRCEVAGHVIRVPRGVRHPLADGSAPFLMRTVGPMVSARHRVLVLGSGCGIGAVVAASRAATVVACDDDPRAVAATESNLRAAGCMDRVTLVRGGPPAGDDPFDLVWFNGRQGPDGYQAMGELLDAVPALLGEQGRLVVAVDRTSGMGEFVRSRVPDGYRVVRLARSPGLLGTWEALSLGWDVEAARARRHAGRDADAKAQVSRKRWRRDAANDPPVEGAVNE